MSEKAPSILVVDPDTDFLDWVRKRLEASNFQVFTAAASDEAYQIFCRDLPDLLITETHLQPFSGLELLAKTRQHNPNAMVIITSTLGTTQTVVESMKLGAFDYIRKEALPFNLKQVVNAALT